MSSKPVILTVDDEPEVLNAIERDLRSHYRSDYRILKAGSGREALEVARELTPCSSSRMRPAARRAAARRSRTISAFRRGSPERSSRGAPPPRLAASEPR
jgi:CheY-like chemotaxis protein